MRLTIGYPGAAEEKRMLEQYAGGSRIGPDRLRPVIATEEWLQMQAEARQTHMHPALLEYMVLVADATRKAPETSLGLSPRALRDWLRASQANAYMEGRGYAIPDDLLATAEAVLPHRLSMRYSAASAAGDALSVIRRTLRDCPFPAVIRSGSGRGKRS
ncbi:hypothetical protein D3C78_1126410 [compost metagenome]